MAVVEKQAPILLYFTFDLSGRIDLLKSIIFTMEKFIDFDFLQKKVKLTKCYHGELTVLSDVLQNLHVLAA